MQTALDTALMKRASLGDNAARRDIVYRLLPRAQRLCRALLREPEDAKDASQSSMMAILKSAATYRGDCSLERWADRIVVRTALSWVARERRKRTAPAELALSAATSHGGETRLLALEYLEKLPEKQATVLLLRCAFEYSVDEIAELVGISRNSVKDRLLRARATMRQLLREEPTTNVVQGPDDALAPERKGIEAEAGPSNDATGRESGIEAARRHGRTR